METPDTLHEDVDLIRRIGMGDRESFSTFFHRYSGLIYSTAFRVLNNATDAEDVAQEVLFMIWEKSPMYDAARGKPITWIVTMTRNKAVDKLRSLQRRFRLQDEVEREAKSDDLVHDMRPVDELDAMEKGKIVRSAVMKLSKEQREVIEMAYFGGLTQQEIATRLEEPLGTVKARIRRGMLRLKKMVGPAL